MESMSVTSVQNKINQYQSYKQNNRLLELGRQPSFDSGLNELDNKIAKYKSSHQEDTKYIEAIKSKPFAPAIAKIVQALPPSKTDSLSDSGVANQRAYNFYNSNNIADTRAIHKQVVAKLNKDGYLTKAAMIASHYSTRSEKGQKLT